ncbi:hypothetical protein L0C25_01940 [Solicola gregarius]|uniref:Tetratricopeptide repeat protein n=1 Tax=Solicola gregarius TaxID=2908642 RepID=A0AA46YLR6_9ACTN|nr:hypothetical protein [Solicola gregarius]UYM05864.1 hypothetical protein L0C25_01940 [Solicola gregarius]
MALVTVKPGEPLARQLSGQHYLVTRTQALVVHALVRLGQAERAGQLLAGLDEHDRERTEIRVATAALRIAQGDPQAALAVLGPAQEGPDSDDYWGFWRARAARKAAAAAGAAQ